MALGRRSGYGSSREKKSGKRFIILIAVVALIGFLGWRKYIGMNLEKANAFFAAGEEAKAEAHFKRVAGAPFSKGRGQDGLGTLDLLAGDPEAAKEHFRVVLAHKPGGLGADPALVFKKFIESGRYESAKIYGDFLRNWKDADDLKPYAMDFASIALGVRELDQAEKALEQVWPSEQKQARYQTLSQRLQEYKQTDAIPVLLDRNDKPLMVYDLKSGAYTFDTPKLFAGWETADSGELTAGLDPVDRLNQIQTTIDVNLQKAAYQAMQGYDGAMVLLDPQTGEILAAYGTEGNSPFTQEFEPGSVIKVLTYGAFLKNGGDVSPYAPKTYPSFEKIGGKIFYDWTTQGKLNSVAEGMAVSCNLMFAQMGLDLGWPKLGETFNHLFDGAEVPGLVTHGSFGKLVREPENAWEMGRASIGLDFLSTTTLGLVNIPYAVANQSPSAAPYMIRGFLTHEGKVYRKPQLNPMPLQFDATVANKLLDSMKEAMENPRGTARRAQLEGVNAAMKTGTAGESPYDSIMIGLFPIPEPRLAFAFFLNKGGKCEINGARVAKNLQTQIKALAPKYMR